MRKSNLSKGKFTLVRKNLEIYEQFFIIRTFHKFSEDSLQLKLKCMTSINYWPSYEGHSHIVKSYFSVKNICYVEKLFSFYLKNQRPLNCWLSVHMRTIVKLNTGAQKQPRYPCEWQGLCLLGDHLSSQVCASAGSWWEAEKPGSSKRDPGTPSHYWTKRWPQCFLSIHLSEVIFWQISLKLPENSSSLFEATTISAFYSSLLSSMHASWFSTVSSLINRYYHTQPMHTDHWGHS